VFLREHCPEVIEALARHELAFFTRSASCEYVGDWGFSALDEVVVQMRLARFRGGRMSLEFTYVNAKAPESVVARGAQEVYCKALRHGEWVAAPFPPGLVRALQRYADTEELQSALADALAFQN
jgi:acyl-CoA thioesterase FadM